MNITVLASGSSGNCYWVSDNSGSPLLLEAGIAYKRIQQTLNFQTANLDGCLITHEHQDHSKAIDEIMKAGIDVYASAGTAEALSLSGHRLHIIEAKKQIRIASWTILPFAAVHDAAEPLGFLMVSGNEKLLYATDTKYIKHRFRGITHLMVEANYCQDILAENVRRGIIGRELKGITINNHMSIQTLVEMLKSNDLSQLQETWLLHLSAKNADSARFKEDIQAITGKPVYV